MKRSLLALIIILALAGWYFHRGDGVAILAYHRVSDDAEEYSVSQQQFAEQMKFLRDQGYTAISLSEMADAFSGKKALPTKPIVITFDDGYADNYLAGLPILEQYGMKATVFVIVGSVGQPEYLTWEQAAQLRLRGVEIGSHTMSHAALSDLDEQQRRHELVESKRILEGQLSTRVDFLAYPYGNFDAALYPLLEQAGYRGACTGIAGLNFAADQPYAWKRINVPRPRFGMLEFRVRLLRAQLLSW